MSRWVETYSAFKKWSTWDPVTWVARNEEIRRTTMGLIQLSKLKEE
jgi:hypothetical protein